MKSSPPSCATSWSPTTWPISVSGRDWTISRPFASASKPSLPASPVSRRNGSMSTSTFRCCSASPCPSPSARCATPGSRSTTPASSACSKSSSMAAAMSAAGPPSKSTTPFSPLSTSPTAPTASTNFATTCASSKATVCYSATAPATPTVSPPRGFRLRCSSCSSTNDSAAHSPTAASTTAPTLITTRPASSKPPTPAPTKLFNRSSISSPPDLSVRLLNSFCLRFSGLESNLLQSGGYEMNSIFQSLIQSNFGDARHGNFEAVIVEGESLTHWWRDNSVAWRPWNRGQRVVERGAAGAGSIIQSNFGDARHGNFEVVVPLRAASGRVELWHYFHDNSDVTKPWERGQRVTGDSDDVAGPGALIQSNFGSRDQGNFEVVVPLQTAAGRVELWHYFHDNSDVTKPWQRGLRVTSGADDVAGPGALIQSNF